MHRETKDVLKLAQGYIYAISIGLIAMIYVLIQKYA